MGQMVFMENWLEDWMKYQNKIFDYWHNNLNSENQKTQPKENNDFEDSMRSAQEAMQKWSDLTSELYKQYFSHLGKFYPQEEVLSKMFNSINLYQTLNKFWEDLQSNITGKNSNLLQFYSRWSEDYSQLVSRHFAPFPPGSMKNAFSDCLDVCNMTTATVNKFIKPWLEETNKMQALLLKSMGGDQQAYIDFIRLWQESYASSFGKVFNIPEFSLNRQSMQSHLQSVDALIKYINSNNEYVATLIKVNQETLQKIIRDYQEMLIQGTQPQTFKEFYDYWWKQSEATYLKLFGTPEFSKLLSQVLDAGVDFKKQLDEVLEQQLKFLPYPTKTDMDSVYKTLDTLKREIRSIREAIQGLENQNTKDSAPLPREED